jgi:serine/threonine protein kinase/predicted Zn-dependent protease
MSPQLPEWLKRRGNPEALADLLSGQAHAGDVDLHPSRPLSRLPTAALEFDLDDPEQRGFGDYELLELLGAGGMGVVYRARQKSLDREVAVKLLAAGPWASADFIKRFRVEAKSAARLQHPNIVPIFEIGSHEGLDYYAMPLMRASLAQRLAASGPLLPADAVCMLRTLAEALDYAHRIGVLHLDLKPGNVLLDADGEPQIADFGLARRLDAALGVDEHEISGTPCYMAPEQVQPEGVGLSRATDVWGLGAILYESLTGRPPFEGDTTDAVIANVARAAVRPPRELRALPRDLEAIVMCCLHRRPSQRYRTARTLADDLARFLDGHSVGARPLNMVQRLGRWALREKRLAAALGIAFAALVTGILATSMLWRRSENNAGLANEVNRFLNNDVLAAANPYLEPGVGPSRITVAAVLTHAGTKLDSNSIHNPVARARIGLTLGRAWFGLGVWDKARMRLEAALTNALASQGPDADLTLDITQQLARTDTFDSQYARAGELYRQLLAARRRNPGWDRPVTIEARRGHVQLLYETGRIKQALSELESTLPAATTNAPDQVAAIEWKLSDLYTELNRWTEAETLVRRALASSRADLGPYDLQYLWQSISLADILLMKGQWDEAETRFRKLHEHLLRRVGPRHPMTLTAAHYLGQVSLERGDLGPALEQLRHVLDERMAVHGESHKWTHYTMNRLGQALVASGRPDEAIKLLERTLKLATDAGYRNQAYVLLVLDNLGDAYLLNHDLDAAEACLGEALARAERTLPANNFRRGLLERSLGRLRELQGRPREAWLHYEYAARVFSEGFGENHPWVKELRMRLQRISQDTTATGS